MKRFSIQIVLFCLLILLPSCRIADGSAKDKRPLKIAFNVWPGCAYVYVAKEKGFFKKYGVDVELILKEEITQSDDAYYSGKVDGIFTPLPNVILLNLKLKSTKIVWTVDYSKTADVIIARPEIKSLKDLKGKPVSFEGINSFSHILVYKLLSRAGIADVDMRFKNVPAQEVLAALESRKIVAGHTWEPTKSKALAKGYKVLATAGDLPGYVTDVLGFSEQVIRERPGDVEAVVRALAEARKYLDENRDDAIGIMSSAENISREEMVSGLSGIQLLTLADNIKAMGDGNRPGDLKNSTEMIRDFYLNRGLAIDVPDAVELFDNSFIVSVAKDQKK